MLELTPEEQRKLLKIARNSLRSAFELSPLDDHLDLTENLHAPHACFVTLMIQTRLRGCIGCMETLSPLHQNASEFARRAAFQDPRFPPLTREEFSGILIEMSVLGPLLPLPQLSDVVIGRHGLHVSDGNQHGVLLAKVADEYGWHAGEFLEQTCLKAGLDPKKRDQYQISYFDEISFSESDFDD